MLFIVENNTMYNVFNGKVEEQECHIFEVGNGSLRFIFNYMSQIHIYEKSSDNNYFLPKCASETASLHRHVIILKNKITEVIIIF